jgi:hypothetical protein
LGLRSILFHLLTFVVWRQVSLFEMVDAPFYSVRDIVLPEGLTELERAEYSAFQEALALLETQWLQLETGENRELQACLAVLQERTAKRKEEARERMRLRIEVIHRQVQLEMERIDIENQEARKALFDRMVREYSQSYQEVTSQLRELGARPLPSLSHAIDFPQLAADSQMETRMQQSEDAKIRSPQDCEPDLNRLQEIFDDNED